MRRTTLRAMLAVAAVLAAAALACNAPTGGPTDADSTATAVALALTTIAQGGATTPPDEAIPPGVTPTVLEPQQPTGPTATIAPQACAAKAVDPVNVRTGPSTYYPILRIMQKDEQSAVTGHNGDRTWYQISGNGWVSGAYLQLSGDCANVPVAAFGPPPPTHTPTYTPTPTATATPTVTPTVPTNTPAVTATYTLPPAVSIDFTAGYAGTWSCGAIGRVSFQIINTGSVTLESMRYRLEGPIGTYINQAQQNAPFKNVPSQGEPDCVQAGSESLSSGNARWVHMVGTSPGAGVTGRAIIKMCSQNDLGGACKEITVDFTY